MLSDSPQLLNLSTHIKSAKSYSSSSPDQGLRRHHLIHTGGDDDIIIAERFVSLQTRGPVHHPLYSSPALVIFSKPKTDINGGDNFISKKQLHPRSLKASGWSVSIDWKISAIHHCSVSQALLLLSSPTTWITFVLSTKLNLSDHFNLSQSSGLNALYIILNDNSRKKLLFLFTPLCVKDDSIKNILSTKSCCSLRAIS